MNASLEAETERLARSWMRHDAAMLRDYLVASVEDPRINLQSIFSRHFLLRVLIGERFSALMEQEYRFAAATTWLTALAGRGGEVEEFAAVHHALAHGADNIEGAEIPRFVSRTFASLPTAAGELAVPNYIASFLSGTRFADGQA